MPVERGYELQTSPRAAAAMPLATAESMGGGVGNALAQAGEQLHNQQVRAFTAERRVKADRELADFSHRYALHRQNMDGIVTELRSNAGPGGAGHRERVKAANEAAREALLGGITEDSVRQRAQAQLDEYDTRLLDTETTFEEGQRVAKRVTDHVDRRDIAANRIRRGVSPDAYAEELRLGLDDIRDAHGLTDAQREKLSKDLEESYGVAFVQNLQDTNPRAAQALIDAGQFDHLGVDVVNRMRAGVRLGIQAEEAAAREEAAQAARIVAEQRKAAADHLDALEVHMQNRDVSSGEISTALSRARAAGVPEDELAKFGYLAEGAAQQRSFRAMETPALIAEARRMEALAEDGELDAAGQRRLERVQGQIAARSKRASDTLGQAWRGSAAQQREVVAELKAMPLSERQVAAADLGARAMLLGSVPEKTSDAAFLGAEVRKARPDDFLPAAGKQDAATELRSIIGPRLLARLGGDYDEVLEAALDVYAGYQTRAGAVKGWDSPAFNRAVNHLFGATESGGVVRGGLGRVRGRTVEMPDGWTAEQFDREYSRLDFSALGAIYADGTAASGADVRANYYPVVEGEDDRGNVTYRFEDMRGQPLMHKSGKVFTLPVTRDPPRPGVRVAPNSGPLRREGMELYLRGGGQ